MNVLFNMINSFKMHQMRNIRNIRNIIYSYNIINSKKSFSITNTNIMLTSPIKPFLSLQHQQFSTINNKKVNKNICHNCGKQGHISKSCPLPRNESRDINTRCFKCGKKGHIAENCLSPTTICFNCGGRDHLAKDCKKPLVLKCFNWKKEGHLIKDCKEKKRENYKNM